MRYLSMFGMALMMASGCSQSTEPSVPDKEFDDSLPSALRPQVFRVDGLT